MDIAALTAISPLDGRYQIKIDYLKGIFSEYGLIKFRVQVEVKWLITLLTDANLPGLPTISPQAKQLLNEITNHFSDQDAAQVKTIEAGINHDVKAIEYFIKDCISGHPELAPLSEFIHFGCTSEDINNLAYCLMLQTARKECLLPILDNLILQMTIFAHDHAALGMLARTHGQAATPTTVGKEIANVVARLKRQYEQLVNVELLGKLNGATGNYNALAVAYPDTDWQQISKRFVTQLGLGWNAYTTQIEPHDSFTEFFAVLIRINNILLDLDRDIWGYIAIGYFNQRPLANEVGSSTMPHKVNPIDFENSEGNLGIANALFEHMVAKLPISRWQRDLSDSTVLRNMGVAVGHSILAYQSTAKGISKLSPNIDMLKNDLDNHWEVLAEAVQMVMRRYHLEQPYEKLKAFTRGKKIDKQSLHQFIAELDLPRDVKNQLLMLTPDSYKGYAEDLAKRI